MKLIQSTLTLASIYLFFAVQASHAYLDPGTGSYLIQILLATTLGGLYIVRGNVSKIKDFITGLFSKVKKKKHDTKK